MFTPGFYVFSLHHVLVKARFPVLYGKYSTRGVVEKAIQHEAKPSAVWLSRPHLECCISRTAQGELCFYYFMVIVRGCIKGTSPRPSEE